MLEAVGVTEEGEAVYRALLRCPASSLSEVARQSSLTRDQAREAISALESKGLVSRSPGKIQRFVPAQPEVAIEVLILRRQEELERVRLALADLQEEFRGSTERTGFAEQVEVALGAAAVSQRYLQLLRSVKRELLGLETAPYAEAPLPASPASGARDQETMLELPFPVPAALVMKPEVRYRVIYQSDALEIPGELARIEAGVEAGEDARTAAQVPMKLAMADRRVAIVPLAEDEPGAGVLVIHSPLLLRTLAMAFEFLWERAAPIRAGRAIRSQMGDPSLPSPEDQRLLALLAAGLKDQAIARQLGIGVSTLERRVRRIAERLGARTRFQTGLLASQREWL